MTPQNCHFSAQVCKTINDKRVAKNEFLGRFVPETVARRVKQKSLNPALCRDALYLKDIFKAIDINFPTADDERH